MLLTLGVVVPTLVPNFIGYLAAGVLPAIVLGCFYDRSSHQSFPIGATGMLVVALGIPLANNIATRIAAANIAKDDRLEPGRQRPPTSNSSFRRQASARSDR